MISKMVWVTLGVGVGVVLLGIFMQPTDPLKPFAFFGLLALVPIMLVWTSFYTKANPLHQLEGAEWVAIFQSLGAKGVAVIPDAETLVIANPKLTYEADQKDDGDAA